MQFNDLFISIFFFNVLCPLFFEGTQRKNNERNKQKYETMDIMISYIL